MSRITKQISEDIAQRLVQPKKDELKAIKKSREELIRAFYLSQLPEGVLKAFRSFKDYFRYQSDVYINGEGLSQTYKSYPFGDALPVKNNERMTLTAEQAKQVIDLDNKADDKQKEINELKTSIEVALLNLRTYNNVEKQFPEAFKLLPVTQVNTSLMVNLKDIRCKLDNSNCN